MAQKDKGLSLEEQLAIAAKCKTQVIKHSKDTCRNSTCRKPPLPGKVYCVDHIGGKDPTKPKRLAKNFNRPRRKQD